jgi:hypothetical protein
MRKLASSAFDLPYPFVGASCPPTFAAPRRRWREPREPLESERLSAAATVERSIASRSAICAAVNDRPDLHSVLFVIGYRWTSFTDVTRGTLRC